MKLLTWKNALRVTLWGGVVAIVLGLVGVITAVIYVVRVTEDLPDYRQLAQYEPPIMSRVHAGDGELIAEFARQQRVFVPIENIPPVLIEAYLSAEDKNFYTHSGIDLMGMVRGGVRSMIQLMRDPNASLQSGSTITQQVAKNFLFSSEQRLERKVREIVIARRMERAFTKDQILELYLNEIYLGNRAYGVAAAALNYFGKSLDELNLHEAAYLAALPKGPSNYHPEREREAALGRRNWVLSRMEVNGYITREQMQAAQAMPLDTVERLTGSRYLAAEYFVEQVRREVFNLYGEDELYDGGLSIRTTLDTNMQLLARRSLRDGLEAYDRRHGYRGPLARIEDMSNWAPQLAEVETPVDMDETWVVGVVLRTEETGASVGLLNGQSVTIPIQELTWARANGRDPETTFPELGPEITHARDVFSRGDVILLEPLSADATGDEEEPIPDNHYGLRQYPTVNGGIIAIDPYTGRVLAMIGGYSFQQSQFNRAVQARRQPGSAFKPFVYAAALEEGMTPASIVLDAPFVASGDTSIRFYRPQNYSEQFYGPSPMRVGLEQSRNVMTVRLAQDIGMSPIVDMGERVHLYDELQPTLAMSLGAGETTLTRLIAAYSSLVNGGRYIEPTIIDRVQDRDGSTIYVHDQRECEACDAEEWSEDVREPQLDLLGENVVDPVTAFQIVHMLEGAVQRGTGTALRELGRPLAGKTGTTNDFRDAWFVGFGPDLIVATYVGFDTPLPLGSGEAGSRVAVPIVKQFLQTALEDYPAAPFRVPEGVRFAPINRRTGEPAAIGQPYTILEAFRPGTEPQRGATAAEETLSFGRGSLGNSQSDSSDEEDDLGGLY